jgi:hypothetical protein
MCQAVNPIFAAESDSGPVLGTFSFALTAADYHAKIARPLEKRKQSARTPGARRVFSPPIPAK